jgi:hypothetical protein
MSNLAEFTSPTLDGGHAAAGPPDEDPVPGSGRRLRRRRPMATLRLVDSMTTTTGVLVATHQSTRTNGRHQHLGPNGSTQGVGHDDDFAGQ